MKYIKHLAILSAIVGLATLTGCTSDDSVLEDLIASNPVVKPIDIALDYTDLDEGDDVIVTDPTDEAYNDYWENNAWTTTVRVAYTQDGATVTGTTTRVRATIDGGHVVINTSASRVHIVASGECSDGSLKVYSDYKYKMTLDGLTLTNPNGAAINNQCGKTLYLVLAEGTENHLEDGETYVIDDESEDMKATLFSEGQVVFSGAGSLSVYSRGKHGIVSDDYLRFRKGNKIYVNSVSGNGIRGKDGVFIDGSVINVETSADGAKAITSPSLVTITGGRTTLITTGAPVVDVALADTSSCAGLKVDSTLVMTGGTLAIKSTGEGGKGINAHQTFQFTGGTLKVVTTGRKGLASPKGIKCDGEMTVQGGYIYSYSAYASPIDATPLSLASGYLLYEPKDRVVTIQY